MFLCFQFPKRVFSYCETCFSVFSVSALVPNVFFSFSVSGSGANVFLCFQFPPQGQTCFLCFISYRLRAKRVFVFVSFLCFQFPVVRALQTCFFSYWKRVFSVLSVLSVISQTCSFSYFSFSKNIELKPPELRFINVMKET